MRLEKLFDNCDWDRKFEHHTPDRDIKYAWHLSDEKEVQEAEKILQTLQEEDSKYCRSLSLGSDSFGEVLVVTEEEWEE